MGTTMLPDHEINTLILTVTEAVDLALAGEIADGYQALLAGLHRAEEIAEEGEPCAEELVARWRRALDTYAKRWGVGRA
jgi:hypothetical protein